MKKAILGTGIAWGILSIFLAILLFAIGALATSAEVIARAQQQSGVTPEQAQQAAQYTQIIMYIAGGFMIASMIYSFVLIGIRNKTMRKGAGIAIGVVGIAIGATLPSVFFLVDSAVNR